MNILLDAQLPRSLVRSLQDLGHQVQHTFDLPDGNRSSDASICAWADHHAAIVFSKDADFVQSHLLQGTPQKLLVITTGNIKNQDLLSLLLKALPTLEDAFGNHSLIELGRSSVMIRS
jgi:predicted nuclease of predicted toxin-antitoxin system